MKTGFIGLGLIGGSIAKAIRQYYPDSEIIAFDKTGKRWHLPPQNPSSTRRSLSLTKISKDATIFFCARQSYIILPI